MLTFTVTLTVSSLCVCVVQVVDVVHLFEKEEITCYLLSVQYLVGLQITESNSVVLVTVVNCQEVLVLMCGTW